MTAAQRIADDERKVIPFPSSNGKPQTSSGVQTFQPDLAFTSASDWREVISTLDYTPYESSMPVRSSEDLFAKFVADRASELMERSDLQRTVLELSSRMADLEAKVLHTENPSQQSASTAFVIATAIANMGERVFVEEGAGREPVVWVTVAQFDVDRAVAIHARELEVADANGVNVDVRITRVGAGAIPNHWQEVSSDRK